MLSASGFGKSTVSPWCLSTRDLLNMQYLINIHYANFKGNVGDANDRSQQEMPIQVGLKTMALSIACCQDDSNVH